jgi:hypothetical protein
MTTTRYLSVTATRLRRTLSSFEDNRLSSSAEHGPVRPSVGVTLP